MAATINGETVALVLGRITSVEAADAVFVGHHELDEQQSPEAHGERLSTLVLFRSRLARSPKVGPDSLACALLACGSAPCCLAAALYFDIVCARESSMSLVASLAFLEAVVHVPSVFHDTAFRTVFSLLSRTELGGAIKDKDSPSRTEVARILLLVFDSHHAPDISHNSDLLAVVVEVLVNHLLVDKTKSGFKELPGLMRAVYKFKGSSGSSEARSESRSVSNAALILKASVHVALSSHKLEKKNREIMFEVIREALPFANAEAGVTFIQHIAIRSPERAEPRHSCSEFVADTVLLLPLSVADKATEWLRSASCHQKIPVRLLSLEVLGILGSRNGAVPTASRTLESCIGRMTDKASSVRTKALSTISLILEGLAPRDRESMIGSLLTNETTGNFNALLRRVADEKSGVRKGALDLIGSILVWGKELNQSCMGQLHECLVSRAIDSVTTVRRAAINALTESICTTPTSSIAMSAWKRGVLPRISDSDTRVQEASIVSFQRVILDRLTLESHLAEYQSAVRLLLEMEQEDPYLIKYSRAIMLYLSEREQLDEILIRGLQAACSRGVRYAWALLEAVSSSRKGMECVANLNFTPMASKLLLEADTSPFAYRLVSKCSSQVAQKTRKVLATKISERLANFDGIDIETIPSAVSALFRLSEAADHSNQQLFMLCQTFISLHSRSIQKNAPKVLAALATAGQILSHSQIDLSSEFLQTLMYLSSTTGQTREQASIQAFSLVVLAKICLSQKCFKDQTSENFVRRCIPVFLSELEGQSPAGRANAVIVLADLCRGFTSLVEPYLNRLAGRLQDPNFFVRKQTILSLTSLVQEDFLKCRAGPLLFPLLRSSGDSNALVRKVSKYALIEVLGKKNSQMFVLCMVETVLHLNDCVAHPNYKNVSLRDIGFKRCEASQRLGVYSLVLSALTAEQKLVTHCRLVREILNAVVDNELDIEAFGSREVLSDTLDLLTSQDMNFVGPKGLSKESEADLEVGETEENQPQAKNSLRAAMKQELMLRTIPVLLELKVVFAKRRSPLLGRLSQSVLTLLRDFRTELDDVLGGNAELITEVEYDYLHENDDSGPTATPRAPSTIRPGLSNRQHPPIATPRALPTSTLVPSIRKVGPVRTPMVPTMVRSDITNCDPVIPSTVKKKRQVASFTDDDVIFERTEDMRRSTVKRRRMSCALRHGAVGCLEGSSSTSDE